MTTRIAQAFRRSAVPLASYYVVTLALPLANGAAGSGGAFTRHALVVLVVPPILIVLACAVQAVVRTVCIPRLTTAGRPPAALRS